MTNDALNTALRNLIKTVMGMPDGSVRPANQDAPAGAQTSEIATVLIMTSADIGMAVQGQTDNLDGSSTASVDQLESVVVSVQFFRSPTKDQTGAAKYATSAVERARSLGRRMQLPSTTAALQALNIGLLDVGTARDLAAVKDSTWESRGQIDLTFDVSSIELEPVITILSAPVDLTFLPPGKAPLPPITFEVFSP